MWGRTTRSFDSGCGLLPHVARWQKKSTSPLPETWWHRRLYCWWLSRYIWTCSAPRSLTVWNTWLHRGHFVPFRPFVSMKSRTGGIRRVAVKRNVCRDEIPPSQSAQTSTFNPDFNQLGVEVRAVHKPPTPSDLTSGLDFENKVMHTA